MRCELMSQVRSVLGVKFLYAVITDYIINAGFTEAILNTGYYKPSIQSL